MAYTDFIAAIDLGSSHMVGMVGAKGPAGTLSIIAYEVENSDTCIRYKRCSRQDRAVDPQAGKQIGWFPYR